MSQEPSPATWDADKVSAFRTWHESRLSELSYPETICEELRKAREAWLRQSQR